MVVVGARAEGGAAAPPIQIVHPSEVTVTAGRLAGREWCDRVGERTVAGKGRVLEIDEKCIQEKF